MYRKYFLQDKCHRDSSKVGIQSANEKKEKINFKILFMIHAIQWKLWGRERGEGEGKPNKRLRKKSLCIFNKLDSRNKNLTVFGKR